MAIKRSIVLPVAALALALGTAHAAEDKQSRDVPNFNQMDKNNDGALTRSEASGNQRLLAHFDKVDDDRDGRLSRAEYLAVMARQDLHTLRDNIAEFIDPDGKAPLAVASQTQDGRQSASSGGTQPSAQSEDGPSLPMAASSQLVRKVQQSLEKKGVDAGPIDGIWGPKTHQALREFQKQQGLESTGQLDARTLQTLGVPGQQAAGGGDSASAGSSSQRNAPKFEKADKDNNGYVSRDEFNAALGGKQTARR